MLNSLIRLLVNSPVYPHWLEVKKKNEADSFLLKLLSGRVLEVGAGDGSRKSKFLLLNKQISEYIATDYAEWDGEFTKIDRLVQRFGEPAKIILGYQERVQLDEVCDAMDLPFKPNSFDFHLSFETLEHISDPDAYFGEASKVVKKGGHIYFSVPFLYRMHGGEPDHRWDFHRYTFGFFHEIARKHNLKVVVLYSNTGYGTTFASMTNQYYIQRIFEAGILLKFLFLLLAPFIFMTTNVVGYILDINPDLRFSTRFHVLYRKQ